MFRGTGSVGRRRIAGLGVVVACGLGAAGMHPTDARGDHDPVCVDTSPPVCVTGATHPAETAEWFALFGAYAVARVVDGVGETAYAGASAIPDPLCVGTDDPVCIHNLRSLAQSTVGEAWRASGGRVTCTLYQLAGFPGMCDS